MLPKITFFFFFGKTSQKVSESVLLQKQHTGVKRQFSDLAAEEDHMCEAKQTRKTFQRKRNVTERSFVMFC